MAATVPYSTPAQAAYLLQNIFRGATPSGSTVVTDTVFVQLISWTDAMIDGNFAAVGYKVPYVALAGETWPVTQTVLLSYMSAVGAAAMAGGHILKPAPALQPGREGGNQNVYALMIDRFFEQVNEHGFHFRAQYHEGTKAEKWLGKRYGPRTDFWSDYWDPTKYELMQDFTNRIRKVFVDIQDTEVDWDYLYSMRATSAD